eukprot:1161259-Pelagomonas_calceolata.AAC.7
MQAQPLPLPPHKCACTCTSLIWLIVSDSQDGGSFTFPPLPGCLEAAGAPHVRPSFASTPASV